MQKSPQPNPRLCISLLPDDLERITKLRIKLEKREGKFLSWAKVIRIAIHEFKI